MDASVIVQNFKRTTDAPDADVPVDECLKMSISCCALFPTLMDEELSE